MDYSKLDPAIRHSESLSIFGENILHFIRPAPNSIYNCHNPKGTLGLGHLKEQASSIISSNKHQVSNNCRTFGYPH